MSACTPTPEPTEAELSLIASIRGGHSDRQTLAFIRRHVAAELADHKDSIAAKNDVISAQREVLAQKDAQIALLRDALEDATAQIKVWIANKGDMIGELAALAKRCDKALTATPESASAELGELRKDAARIELLNGAILGGQFHQLSKGPTAQDVTLTVWHGSEVTEYASNHLRNVIDAAMKQGD